MTLAGAVARPEKIQRHASGDPLQPPHRLHLRRSLLRRAIPGEENLLRQIIDTRHRHPERREIRPHLAVRGGQDAIKLARKWASAQGRPPERRVIVTCHGSFHGRTLAAVTATAQPKYQAGYEPLPGGFRHVDFNDLDQLEAAMAGAMSARC